MQRPKTTKQKQQTTAHLYGQGFPIREELQTVSTTFLLLQRVRGPAASTTGDKSQHQGAHPLHDDGLKVPHHVTGYTCIGATPWNLPDPSNHLDAFSVLEDATRLLSAACRPVPTKKKKPPNTTIGEPNATQTRRLHPRAAYMLPGNVARMRSRGVHASQNLQHRCSNEYTFLHFRERCAHARHYIKQRCACVRVARWTGWMALSNGVVNSIEEHTRLVVAVALVVGDFRPPCVQAWPS